MVVHHPLDRNQPAVLVDLDPKAEVQLRLNPLVNFPSLARSLVNNPCSVPISPDLGSSRSSHILDSFQDSPDPRVELLLARSAKEVTDSNRGRNLVHSRFHLVPEVIVDQDRNLVLSLSRLVVGQGMVGRVALHRLLDRNPSVADTIMVHMES